MVLAYAVFHGRNKLRRKIMARITRGKTFQSGELVTNTKLHQLIDSAVITDIVQADLLAGYGMVEHGTTAPTDTDALWYDENSSRLKVYGGGVWNTCLTGGMLKPTNSDSSGYLFGMYLTSDGTVDLDINAGRMILSDDFLTYDGSSVDISDDFVAATNTSGKKSTITYANGTNYYVFAITDSASMTTDEVLIYIDTSTTPTDYTLGTDARLIGRFTYYVSGDTIYPYNILNYRNDGIIGMTYIVGSGAGATADATVSLGLNTSFGPHTIHSVVGSMATAADPPYAGVVFDSQSPGFSLYNAVDFSSFKLAYLPANGANSNAAKWYGIQWRIFGAWNV